MSKKRFYLLLFLTSIPFLMYSQNNSELELKSKLGKTLVYFHKHGVTIKPENDTMYIYLYDWIGTAYRYGGTSKKGIDCSGFANQVYAYIYNIDLPRSSRAIYKKCDERVKKKNLRFGDLLFFKIGKHRKVSHVGIYLNNGKFIHASTSSGVIISNLDLSYYKKYFYKAMRINE